MIQKPIEKRGIFQQFIRSPLSLISLFLLVLIIFFLLFQRFVFLPKILILILIFLSVFLNGRMKHFLKDWFVFISIIYLFDSLRGAIYLWTCKFGLPVYTLYAISLEKLLFQDVPSIILQQWLLSPIEFTWLEKLLTIIHGSHFVAFLVVGFLI